MALPHTLHANSVSSRVAVSMNPWRIFLPELIKMDETRKIQEEADCKRSSELKNRKVERVAVYHSIIITIHFIKVKQIGCPLLRPSTQWQRTCSVTTFTSTSPQYSFVRYEYLPGIKAIRTERWLAKQILETLKVFLKGPHVILKLKQCNTLNVNKVYNLLQLEREEEGTVSNIKPFKLYFEINIFLHCVQDPFRWH